MALRSQIPVLPTIFRKRRSANDGDVGIYGGRRRPDEPEDIESVSSDLDDQFPGASLDQSKWIETVITGTLTVGSGEADFEVAAATKTVTIDSYIAPVIEAGKELVFKCRFKWAGQTATDPSIGIGVRLDNENIITLTKNNGDDATAWRCRNESDNVSTVTGNKTVTEDAYHILTITMTTSSVVFDVDGSTLATHTTNIPTGKSLRAVLSLSSQLAQTHNLFIDYVTYNRVSL